MMSISLLALLALTVPVHVDTAAKPTASAWTCSGGVPFPDGALMAADCRRLVLTDRDG